MKNEHNTYCPACRIEVHRILPVVSQGSPAVESQCASTPESIKHGLQTMKKRYILPIVLVPIVCLVACVILTSAYKSHPSDTNTVAGNAGSVKSNVHEENYDETRRLQRDVIERDAVKVLNGVNDEDEDYDGFSSYQSDFHNSEQELFPDFRRTDEEVIEMELTRLYEEAEKSRLDLALDKELSVNLTDNKLQKEENFLFPTSTKEVNDQTEDLYVKQTTTEQKQTEARINLSGEIPRSDPDEKISSKTGSIRKRRDIAEVPCSGCGEPMQSTPRATDEDHYAEYGEYLTNVTAEEIVWTVPDKMNGNESHVVGGGPVLHQSTMRPSEHDVTSNLTLPSSGNEEAVPDNGVTGEFLETGKSDPLGVDKYSSDGEGSTYGSANEKLSWQESNRDSAIERETYIIDKSKRKTKVNPDPAMGTFWRGGGNRDSIRQTQADIMRRYMDTTISPCTDFYQYACGNWSKHHPIPKDKGGYDTFELLRESLDEVLRGILEEPFSYEKQVASNDARLKAKYLYQSCMNYEILENLGEKPLLQLLRDFGGWPIITPNWNSTEFNWITLMAKLRLFNNDILISEWVGPDIKNSDEYIIQFDQTSLGLPTREYFLQPSNMKYLNAYKAHMIHVATLLGASIDNATIQAEEMIRFETMLASLTSSPEQRRNVSALYQRMTVSSLRKIVPQLDWYTYLDVVLARPVRVDEPVVVFALKYVQEMIRLVSETPPRVVTNYLLWRFVRHRVSNLDNRFQDAKQRFYFTVFGREQSPPRWKSCVAQVNSNMGMALGAMFVDQYFDEDSKNDTLHMTLSITQSFRELLGNTTWIDSNTKQIALWKVGAMLLRIGYPDFILDQDELNRRYKDVDITPTNYFENTLNILRHITRVEQDRIGEIVNKTQWNTAPAVVNAYYSRNKNQIIFPAGMLQPPFYHRYFPKSLNFGGIGVVIGHEITHGFDDKGRLFDHHGNLQRWWTDEAIEGFHRRAQCLIDQYSQYIVPDVNLAVDGVNTQGENIADNAGIKQAYIAYHRWLDKHGGIDDWLPGINATNDQLFFLNYAQVWCGSTRPETARNKQKTTVHAPGKFRVIGTLSNSREFANAYDCPLGSAMNPVVKCSVW